MKKALPLLLLVILTSLTIQAADKVTATINGLTTTMSNGIVSITIGSNGRISNMTLNGGKNLIGSTGVYFDFTSKALGNKPLSPAKAELVKLTDDYAEVVYTNESYAPRYQQGFILRRGVSGIYMYVVANTSAESKDLQVQEVRVCTRLASDFLNGYVDDSMQGRLPSNSEMAAVEANGKENENYVQDATYRMSDGSIYTKYNWAQYVVRDSVHGLMNANTGVWNIPCSREWMTGGPMKQELTVHATGKSPITIQMLHGEHFGCPSIYYKEGKKKLYGPFFLYLNNGKSTEEMIADAKREAHEQEQQWPFQWFDHELYPKDRATVSGRINVTTGQRCDSIQVVLGEPGVKLYDQCEKYAFWTLTDKDGYFTIPNVRKDDYTLYAYATCGDVTDELQVTGISIDSEQTDLGTITWTPKRYVHKLFQIGENNRMSDGFKWSDTLRSYGLWNNVPATLTYNAEESNPEEDWYYAQTKNGTWTITFNLDETYTGNAYLTASIAGATNKPKVAVGVNGTNKANWSFSTNDGAIYRSARLGGRHDLKTLTFPASLLKKGENKITLTLSGISGNGGILWDCLKLEAGGLFVVGDANGDGVVDVADVVAITNKILEKPGDSFNFEAADVNADGVIDVSDVVSVVNIILKNP